MQTSATITEIARALAAAQGEFRSVQKSGENKFDRYSYAKLEDYVKAVGDILHKHGLSRLASVEKIIALDDRETKNGSKEHAVRVKLMLRIMHTSGEWIEVPSFGEGQDRADKAIYKAVTGAHKYALASALGLATTDDPEDDGEPAMHRGQQQQRQHPAQRRQAPAPRQPEQGDALEPDAREQAIINLSDLITSCTVPAETERAILEKEGVTALGELADARISYWVKTLAAKLNGKAKATA